MSSDNHIKIILRNGTVYVYECCTVLGTKATATVQIKENSSSKYSVIQTFNKAGLSSKHGGCFQPFFTSLILKMFLDMELETIVCEELFLNPFLDLDSQFHHCASKFLIFSVIPFIL